MKTITLSTRLEENEAQIIDQCAKEDGLDRSTFLKQLLKKGLEEYMLKKALNLYRKHIVSLRDFISRLPAGGAELNYSLDDLKHDAKIDV